MPELYSNVPLAVLIEKEPTIPETHINRLQNLTEEAEVKKELCWLRHVQEKVKDSFDGSLKISWSAFQVDCESEKDMLPSLTALLPLFEEQPKSVAMICHSMNMIKASVDMLNPRQTSVVSFDQPLYTIAKQIQ